MHFMMLMKANQDYENGTPPDPRLMAAMAKYTAEQMKRGVVVATGGLVPSRMGTRLVAENGMLLQVDGPFAETKELLGGYAIINAASHEEAIEHGKAFMNLHYEILGRTWEGTLEIRQVFGPNEGPCPSAQAEQHAHTA